MRTLTVAAAMAAGLVLAACGPADGPLGTDVPDQVRPELALINTGAGNGQADFEEFEVCKVGSSATIDYSVFDRRTGTTTTGTLSLNDGDCQVVAQFGGPGADVTVTETSAEPGFELDRVEVTVISGTVASPSLNSRTEAGPSVTELIGGGAVLRGALVVFHNKAVERPGGQGCTPGYWKQPHHFRSWPAPYQPSDLFSAYFENAFPGKTLLQVLSQGGGGLVALGRHTVAALLNAASSNVSYDLTVQQVVDAFNAAYPGTTSSYNTLKDRFEYFNEQGCPLN